MKKVSTLVLCVCLAIGHAIAFTGCAYSSIASNLMTPNVNKENFCVISIDKDIYKIEIDGKRVKEANIFLGYTAAANILPPGHHKIVVQFNSNYQQHAEGDARYSTWNKHQQVIEREFENGQYYYIVPLKYQGELTAMVINETDPSVWEKQNGSSVSWAQERRKMAEKKLGIK